jgi:hypothetical protein
MFPWLFDGTAGKLKAFCSSSTVHLLKICDRKNEFTVARTFYYKPLYTLPSFLTMLDISEYIHTMQLSHLGF